jgi:formate dehydrogenase iron-sulfur subunit
MMILNRRQFLKNCGIAGAGIAVAGSALPALANTSNPISTTEPMGIITDLSLCIGCRRCEWACNNEPSNQFETIRPMSFYEDRGVLTSRRFHSPDALTVVNRYEVPGQTTPVFVKSQCFHCNEPACASACLVSAIEKCPQGAVNYDAWRCMGCRYCLVACPFQVPAYEYNRPLTPRVRKCTMCYAERTSKGKMPACVEICPVQCMTYGPRNQLLTMARARIANHPGYLEHIYGENEIGGTSWLYLSKVPFEQLGFATLPTWSTARFVEKIQHSIFRYFVGPVMLYGFLGTVMWIFRDSPDLQTPGEVDGE